MNMTRRQLLAGSSAALIFPRTSMAQPLPASPAIPKGWNTLPLGAGGLVTGFSLAPDGTMVCRTDVGNIYRWTGTTATITNPNDRWVPLLTFGSLGARAKPGWGIGAYEHVLSPSKTTNHYAIFVDMTGLIKWWLWYSTNSGATWNRTNISLLNADPNGSQYKNAYYKIAVDPVNETVVYCGMPTGSGNSCSVYRAIDGQTFSALTTDGPTSFPQTIVGSGVCGICFDLHAGTITVNGQIRTKRVIIPVGGVGIYESLDGGQTFKEVAATAFGGTNFSVFNGAMNYYGVYYCVSLSLTLGNHVWRYSGAAGTWTQIDPIARYVSSGTIVIPDSRASNPGYLSVTGPNGIGAGYTSHNADKGTPNWRGRTGGEIPKLTAPSYDIPYMNYVSGQGHVSAFAYGTAAVVDPNGVCWWSGNQSFWYFTAIPDYGSSVYTTSVSVSRGMEITVAQDVLCPAGATFPILAAQDLGGPLRGTFTSYPTDMAYRYKQYTCENLEYAASDPRFVVARITGQQGDPFGDYSAYSTNFGEDGSWTPISATPTSLWQTTVTGSISNDSGGSGLILNVTSVGSGTVWPAQLVYSGKTYLGKIQPYGTSGTIGSGGVGTYYLDRPSHTPSTTFSLVCPIQGGQTVAIDHDHWITVPSGLAQWYVPAYTANATSQSCTWALTNLPAGWWMLRGWSYGATSKPLAVGYGSDLGTVWAALYSNPTITVYKSTDYGATFSAVGSVSAGLSIVGTYLLSVPGHPGELWLTGLFTGGGGLWHSSDWGTTWNSITRPGLVYDFCLGASQTPGGYPTLYGLFYATYGAPKYLYQGTYSGGSVRWNLFGPTGTQADLPKSCQLAGIQSIRGDWNVYGRLYVSSQQSGFAYYNP